MSKYYVYTDGVVRGPFQLEEMASMLSDGRVELATPVSTGKGTPWQTVADRSEIIEEKNNLANKQQQAEKEKKIRINRQNSLLLSELPPEI